MALRIITCSCVLAVLAASLARGGSVDVQPLGQLTRLYGGPIREYPQQVIVRLNDLSRGPILINPQDALQRSDTLPGADLLPGPVPGTDLLGRPARALGWQSNPPRASPSSGDRDRRPRGR